MLRDGRCVDEKNKLPGAWGNRTRFLGKHLKSVNTTGEIKLPKEKLVRIYKLWELQGIPSSSFGGGLEDLNFIDNFPTQEEPLLELEVKDTGGSYSYVTAAFDLPEQMGFATLTTSPVSGEDPLLYQTIGFIRRDFQSSYKWVGSTNGKCGSWKIPFLNPQKLEEGEPRNILLVLGLDVKDSKNYFDVEYHTVEGIKAQYRIHIPAPHLETSGGLWKEDKDGFNFLVEDGDYELPEEMGKKEVNDYLEVEYFYAYAYTPEIVSRIKKGELSPGSTKKNGIEYIKIEFSTKKFTMARINFMCIGDIGIDYKSSLPRDNTDRGGTRIVTEEAVCKSVYLSCEPKESADLEFILMSDNAAVSDITIDILYEDE